MHFRPFFQDKYSLNTGKDRERQKIPYLSHMAHDERTQILCSFVNNFVAKLSLTSETFGIPFQEQQVHLDFQKRYLSLLLNISWQIISKKFIIFLDLWNYL